MWSNLNTVEPYIPSPKIDLIFLTGCFDAFAKSSTPRRDKNNLDYLRLTTNFQNCYIILFIGVLPETRFLSMSFVCKLELGLVLRVFLHCKLFDRSCVRFPTVFCLCRHENGINATEINLLPSLGLNLKQLKNLFCYI